MLKYYDEICKKNRVLPRRILLSFAPVSSKKNIEAQRLNQKYTLTNDVINEIEKILEDEQEKARLEIAQLVNDRLDKIEEKLK